MTDQADEDDREVILGDPDLRPLAMAIRVALLDALEALPATVGYRELTRLDDAVETVLQEHGVRLRPEAEPM